MRRILIARFADDFSWTVTRVHCDNIVLLLQHYKTSLPVRAICTWSVLSIAFGRVSAVGNMCLSSRVSDTPLSLLVGCLAFIACYSKDHLEKGNSNLSKLGNFCSQYTEKSKNNRSTVTVLGTCNFWVACVIWIVTSNASRLDYIA